MKKVIMTADRPTGRLHIGHFVGSLRERVNLQNEGNYDELYVMIADSQALTDNAGNPQKVRDNIMEVMLDYLSVGLDPEKTTFCVQSCLPALPELTQFYMNLVSMPRMLRNPTVKTEIKMRGFDSNESGLPVGFACYPISQAADITSFKANLIPVGADQAPMLEQTREIVRSFNNTYNTDCLVECEAYIPKVASMARLPGTDGNKMSKSLGNCIFLSDEPEEIKKKINSISTFPRKLEEPGILKDNILFAYLDAFAVDSDFEKYYPEFKNLDELKKAYQKGGLGDGKIKAFLNNVLQDKLAPIRERRKELSKNIDSVIDILEKGNKKALEKTNQTLLEVKQAMGIDYFSSDAFRKEQREKFNK